MIVLEVRFFTNNIAKGKGNIAKKHCWTNGMVRLHANNLHGIKPVPTSPFGSLMELNNTIERVLIKNQIKLHPSNKTRKYIVK
jgi:hypothetical protein